MNDSLSGNNKTNEDILKTIQMKLSRIDAILLGMHQMQIKEEHREMIRKEWSQLCVVLDRVCLIFFLIVSTCFTIGLMTH